MGTDDHHPVFDLFKLLFGVYDFDPLFPQILNNFLIVDDGTVCIDFSVLVFPYLFVDFLHRTFDAETKTGGFR